MSRGKTDKDARKMTVPEPKPLIVLFAAENTSPSVLYGLYDVLTTTGAAWPEMIDGSPGPQQLDIRIVGPTAEPFRCTGGVPVEPHEAYATVERADAVIVCDLYTPIDRLPRRPEAEHAWLRRLYAEGSVVASVCSGALVLAEAGLLRDCEATSHWGYAELFRRKFPSVRFRPELTVCVADAEERLITSGAVTSWQDLALHLITRFCGRAAAIETAKVFLLDERRDGAAPFCAMPRIVAHSDAVIGACQSWIAENCAEPHPVQAMAARSGLNERTFARRFRAATGFAPLDYVHTVRVEEAKQRLETSDERVDDIALAVGYEDLASFRRIFKRKAGLAPQSHRRKFRRIAGAPALAEA